MSITFKPFRRVITPTNLMVCEFSVTDKHGRCHHHFAVIIIKLPRLLSRRQTSVTIFQTTVYPNVEESTSEPSDHPNPLTTNQQESRERLL